MKYLKRFFYGFIVLALLLLVFSFVVMKIEDVQCDYLRIENQPSLQNNSYVIKNVNIIPMTSDTVLVNRNVKVVDGIIESINYTSIKPEDLVIDAKGNYLSPGLIDMHMHLWDRLELGLYLANGVTTVRSLLGMPFHLDVKKEINNNKLIGPLFYTAAPQFSGIDDGDILKKRIESPEKAKKLIIKYKEEGYDYIKTYNMLPKDIFDAVLEQGVISGIPIISHPSFKVDYSYHFNPIITTVEHTEDIYQQPLNYTFDYKKLDEVVEGYALSHQTHCPTLTVFHNLVEIYNKGEEVLTTEQAGYINPFIFTAANDYDRHMGIRARDSTSTERINKQHNFHIEAVQKLYEAGVNIVCGTDAGIVFTAAGFSIHDELEFYKQAGMSDFEALKTATINPTKVYKEYTQFGTIEDGKMANFILSKINPLDDLATLKDPEWVMVKGRLINNELMEEFKDKAYQRKNYLASMIRVYKYILWDK